MVQLRGQHVDREPERERMWSRDEFVATEEPEQIGGPRLGG